MIKLSSFQTKLILGMGLIEAFIFTLLVLSSLKFLLDSNKEALQSRAFSTVQILSVTLKESLISSDLARIDSISEELITHSQIEFIRIYDEQERLIVDKNAYKPMIEKTKTSYFWDFYSMNDVLQVENQVDDAGQHFGRIELGFSDNTIDLLLMNAQKKLVFIACGALILFMLLSYFLGIYLSFYFTQFRKAHKKIFKGEIGYQLPVKGGSELSQAVREFNKMSLHLELVYNQLNNELQHLLAALNNTMDGIIMINAEGIIRTVNPAAEKIFGFTQQALEGHSFLMLMSENYQVQWRAFMPLAEKNMHLQVIKGLRQNGDSFSMEISIGCVKTAEKVMFNCIVRDISSRVAMESMAQLSRKVFENTSEAIILTDAQSRIIDVNPAYERVMGYSRAEVLGADPKITHSKQHSVKFYQTMWQSIDKKGHWEGEILDRRKDGKVFPTWLTINSIKDAQGNITHYVGLFKDISQHRMI